MSLISKRQRHESQQKTLHDFRLVIKGVATHEEQQHVLCCPCCSPKTNWNACAEGVATCGARTTISFAENHWILMKLWHDRNFDMETQKHVESRQSAASISISLQISQWLCHFIYDNNFAGLSKWNCRCGISVSVQSSRVLRCVSVGLVFLCRHRSVCCGGVKADSAHTEQATVAFAK